LSHQTAVCAFDFKNRSINMKIGINGFGRIGRLVCRAAFEHKNIEIVQINDPGGNAETFCHLLNFDSVHGRWHRHAQVKSNESLQVGERTVQLTGNREIGDTDWSGCDLVIESSGFMRKKALLQAYLDQGVKQVVVSAPLSDDILNIVMGVNHTSFDKSKHSIVTAASCTTNCLAPIVKVLYDNFGIKHGSMTTIHSATNDQVILDSPHSDLRRARATGSSLIPTSTGSAAAITEIFPELKGKINGHAVRVPLTNASLTDAVFELEKPTTRDEVNALFKKAAKNELASILAYEDRPLVSIDYKTDPHSVTIDGPSTMVINGTHVKIYGWYDNEWGYSNRVVELVNYIRQQLA